LDSLIGNEITNLKEITGVSLVETSWTWGFVLKIILYHKSNLQENVYIRQAF
jgi:hypothetical protein